MPNLENFSNEKLIDIVKNYKLFRYEEHIKDQALAILSNRGISEEDLKLVGNVKGQNIDRIQSLYKQFRINSNLAFGIYLLLVFFQFFVNSWFMLGILFFCFCIYFWFLISSFRNQNEFYSVLGQKENASNAFIYFLVGMPFYPIFYIYIRKGMRENLL